MIPLETQRLILRDFVESDWQAVHQYASDRKVVIIGRHTQKGQNCPLGCYERILKSYI